MNCISTVTRRKNKTGKVIGLAFDCSGECAPGLKCDRQVRYDPTDPDRVIEFCACDSETLMEGGSATLIGYVNGPCRIGLLRQRPKSGKGMLTGAPVDFVCVGRCPNAEGPECKPVVIKTEKLANGDEQETIECQCIRKVEAIGKKLY